MQKCRRCLNNITVRLSGVELNSVLNEARGCASMGGEASPTVWLAGCFSCRSGFECVFEL